MKIAYLVTIFSLFFGQLTGQYSESNLSTDSLELEKRKKTLLIGSISTYTVSSIGLYFAWYKNYNQEKFHFFNDWNEWNNMDKMGHIYSSYAQSDLMYQLSKWSGYNEKSSLTIACLTALSFQTTFEIMDGFSSRWGFSVPDITANLLGVGSFYAQQKLWNEQRIRFKLSYWPVDYSDQVYSSETNLFNYTLANRAASLYGSNFLEKLVKDYNGQTIWMSANLKSFWKNSSLPNWLNIALGFGVNNIYGGYRNTWELIDENFIVSREQFPRTRHFVISPDVDFSKIQAKSPFMKTLFSLINILKIPAPAIVIDSSGKVSYFLIFKH